MSNSINLFRNSDDLFNITILWFGAGFMDRLSILENLQSQYLFSTVWINEQKKVMLIALPLVTTFLPH